MCSSTICPPLETNNLLGEMNGNVCNISLEPFVPFFSVLFLAFEFSIPKLSGKGFETTRYSHWQQNNMNEKK